MKREPLPALTGLRFVAAACVVTSHALPSIVPVPDPPNWYIHLGQLAGIGMPLFFVLSGFVIHYNYADQLNERPLSGTYNFFVARFARLYPLFFFCLVYDWLHSYSYSQLTDQFSRAAPYYLTMTQTWTYQALGPHNLVFTFGVVPQVTWSISTEWFFYCAYPLILLGPLRSKRIRHVLGWAAAITLISFAVFGLIGYYRHIIETHAVATYGALAGGMSDEAFWKWLNYFSPYAQISNFILGCLAAELFNKLERRPISYKEGYIGLGIGLLSIGVTWLLFIVMYDRELRPEIPLLNDSIVFGPSLAGLIFCCARYRNTISDWLSAKWMLFCGEVSYSIYLLHFQVIYAFRWEAAKITEPRIAIADNLRLTMVMLAIIGLSYMTYSIIEAPSRKALTRLLAVRQRAPVSGKIA